MEKTVAEMFAGVGGFRVGLNNVRGYGPRGHAKETGEFTFVWADQWEPSTKGKQDAFKCYISRFGKKSAINENIRTYDKTKMPDHTLLVGGFPCQDYSVARTISTEKGIQGKKGVLWWDIRDVLLKKKPPFVLLENVDRLIKAPSRQKGQAFGIMLRCFNEAGYGVQWRVINAADYGHPQRRRRTFIFAFLNTTKYYKAFSEKIKNGEKVVAGGLMFDQGFPCKAVGSVKTKGLDGDEFPEIIDVSNRFSFDFENSGYCLNLEIVTQETEPNYDGDKITLADCLRKPTQINQSCFTFNQQRMQEMKSEHHIKRTTKDGFTYIFSEGAIPFPDPIDVPSRTMLTSEGTTNRSTHVIEDPIRKEYRLLDPVECERLDEFPDNWTNTGMSKARRYFVCGNALVTGLIYTMGQTISKIIDDENVK